MGNIDAKTNMRRTPLNGEMLCVTTEGYVDHCFDGETDEPLRDMLTPPLSTDETLGVYEVPVIPEGAFERLVRKCGGTWDAEGLHLG
jgi:hypothetical protein